LDETALILYGRQCLLKGPKGVS